MPGCAARPIAPAPKHEIAIFDKLNTWYYGDAPKTVRPMLEIARRATTFEEVVQGLDETNALYEARRCLSCGNCFECDNCYGVCPDNAVIKLGPGKRFEFNYDYLQGLRRLRAGMPVRRDRDGAGGDLNGRIRPQAGFAAACATMPSMISGQSRIGKACPMPLTTTRRAPGYRLRRIAPRFETHQRIDVAMNDQRGRANMDQLRPAIAGCENGHHLAHHAHRILPALERLFGA